MTTACDSGTKYLDTIYNPKWLEAHDLHLIEIETVFADVLIEPKIGSPGAAQPVARICIACGHSPTDWQSRAKHIAARRAE
ncbi:MAG: hypothetical protein ABJ251_00895 [Paracoccaceae bacterium]